MRMKMMSDLTEEEIDALNLERFTKSKMLEMERTEDLYQCANIFREIADKIEEVADKHYKDKDED